ncbi:unnamed protein product [Leptosia nina]|uniref:Uncharacterized protein n=1 Tax=Leptosia nina TaxID=320188 RepID=A0AAV1JNV1_9NEOP
MSVNREEKSSIGYVVREKKSNSTLAYERVSTTTPATPTYLVLHTADLKLKFNTSTIHVFNLEHQTISLWA